MHEQNLAAWAITEPDQIPGIEAEWKALHAQNPQLSFFSSYEFILNTCRFLLRPSDSIFIVTLRRNGDLVGVVPLCFSKKKHAGISYVAAELLGCREGDRPGVSTAISLHYVWKALQTLLEHEKGRWQVLHLAEMDQMELKKQFPPFAGSPRYSCFLERDRIGYSVSLRGSFKEYFESRPPGVQRLFRRHMRATERKAGFPELIVYSGESVTKDGLSRFGEIEKKSRKLAQGIALVSNPRRVEFYRSLCRELSESSSAHIFIWSANGQDMAGSLVFTHGRHVYEREIAFDQEYQAVSPGVLLQAEMFKHHFGLGFDDFDLLAMHPSHGEPRHKVDWATHRHETFRFSAIVTRSRLFPWICMQKLKQRDAFLSGLQHEAA